jgi:hypothetical protein
MSSRLSFLQRAQIKSLRESGENLSWKQIGDKVGCSPGQAWYWNQQKDIKDHKHTGRPAKQNPMLIRYIVEETLLDPKKSSAAIARPLEISKELVRIIRKNEGFRWLNSIKRVPLTNLQKNSG